MNFKDFSNYCSNTRALIIGDIMLDRYVIGDVNRISPEAPVPVFLSQSSKQVLGGVGNVYNNLLFEEFQEEDTVNDYKGDRLFVDNTDSTWKVYERTNPNLYNQIIHKGDILMVTRSADGISLFYNSEHHHIPTKARSIHDVSGAGDTVIAVYCLSEISGANPLESALIANNAAGRVCEQVGVVPITLSLLNDILN